MKHIVIDRDRIILNGNQIDSDSLTGISMLTSIYKRYNMSYPKYYKMDPLCRLGFIGAELLLDKDIDGDRHAIVIAGRSGSIIDDIRYQETINDEEDYFPSPAVFVYTLANIVTGEIAIRHKIYGETSSYLINDYNPEAIATLLTSTFDDSDIDQITGGWIEATGEDDFTLRFVTIDRKTSRNEIIGFFKENIINN
ncbi:MAG: hypothetical protein K2L41_02340 [Muribaculaceae bacterium]|nr:hypothetical protein [Muribaculaceae bacterium]